MPFIPVEDWRVKEARKLLEDAMFLTVTAGIARDAAQTADTQKDRRRFMRLYRKHSRLSRRYIRQATKLRLAYERGMR